MGSGAAAERGWRLDWQGEGAGIAGLFLHSEARTPRRRRHLSKTERASSPGNGEALALGKPAVSAWTSSLWSLDSSQREGLLLQPLAAALPGSRGECRGQSAPAGVTVFGSPALPPVSPTLSGRGGTERGASQPVPRDPAQPQVPPGWALRTGEPWGRAAREGADNREPGAETCLLIQRPRTHIILSHSLRGCIWPSPPHHPWVNHFQNAFGPQPNPPAPHASCSLDLRGSKWELGKDVQWVQVTRTRVGILPPLSGCVTSGKSTPLSELQSPNLSPGGSPTPARMGYRPIPAPGPGTGKGPLTGCRWGA